MTIINETSDSVLNASASGSYNLVEGDVFNGTLSPTDTQDAVNLTGLTPGQAYTVSVTVDDPLGNLTLILVNHSDFHSHGFNFIEGVPLETTGFDRHFASADAPEVDGNTFSFTFTPAPGITSFAFALQTGDNETYSLSFEEAVLENVIDGTTASDRINGGDGVDIITGDLGDDHLHGRDGNDVLNGGVGKDKLTGGTGDDTLNGDDGNDVLLGGVGNDVLNGGARNDRMHGDDGNDLLNASTGNDKLYGGAGNDTVDGGKGRDLLAGGSDADIFVFENGSHKDTITDFEDGLDVIDFTGDAAITSMANLSITQNGVDVVIDHGGGDQITVQNMNVADIDGTDFLF